MVPPLWQDHPHAGNFLNARNVFVVNLGHLFDQLFGPAGHVQLFLERGGEIVFHVALEEVEQEDRDDPALVLGDQAVLLLADVFAVLNRGDNAGIGRGPADAELFHA